MGVWASFPPESVEERHLNDGLENKKGTGTRENCKDGASFLF